LKKLILLLFLTITGCSQFPSQPVATIDHNIRQWKVKSTNFPDYFQYLDKTGKIVSLGYDDNGDGRAEVRIDLRNICQDKKCPHYVILLDGIPYKLIEKYYNDGGFRLFYKPIKLISVFPSLTDTAFSEIFHVTPIRGFEAQYYDRQKGKLSDGDSVYLSGENAPWEKHINYRAPMWLDPIGYLYPNFVFNHELTAMEKLFEHKHSGTVIAYSVGSANTGTRYGAKQLIECLKRVDKLCEKIIYERRGRANITILADHGHNLTAGKYFDIKKALKNAGFNPTNKLKKPGDVICIEFGLVTCAEIYTNQPATVANTMLKYPQVNLAIYPLPNSNNSKIIVSNKTDKALISKTDKGYIYHPLKGDPLKLKPIIAKLKRIGKVYSDGAIDDKALFQATIDHIYPDPLARIWRAYHGLVKHPCDIILTIKDGWFCGKSSFARMVNIASTHGSLNWDNSVTFLLTTEKLDPRPIAIRAKDVSKYIYMK